MRTTVIVAGVGIALAALCAGMSPGRAEPVTNAYPYCLLGRGGGSTTCYFRTRAECGNGCIGNPAYVGEVRARAILADAGVAGERRRATARATGVRNPPRAAFTADALRPRIDPGAHASAGEGFAGWPTDYLMDRFGDRQSQGRF
jgi:hypothetical protein